MIFGISGTKRTVRNTEKCPNYRGVRKERFDCNNNNDIDMTMMMMMMMLVVVVVMMR